MDMLRTLPLVLRCFWYSNLFQNEFGLDLLTPATTLLRRHLPHASIGANYAPFVYTPAGYASNIYLYPVNKAVTAFRRGALTLPWGEDYSWQSPIGTQQMSTLLLDMFRAGRRHAKTAAERQTMFYTMAHAPGNTPASWRRNFFGYCAHGMTMLNLYEFRPTVASYTENYVATGWGMYAEVRKSLAELSAFEDILQSGSVADGDVGLWASDAFDIWGPATPPSLYGQHHSTFLAGKRALYIALLHAELAVDVVVEDDIGPTLDSYAVIVLADTHVTDAAAEALAKWVEAGGTLVATAGAGMFNEFNETNKVLTGLLGIRPVAMHEPDAAAVQYIKQDLHFAQTLGNVHWTSAIGTNSINQSSIQSRNRSNSSAMRVNCSGVVLGARPVFQLSAAPGLHVIATYDDGKPAATSLASGRGRSMYVGWLPGLDYFLPAIPARPPDRGGTDEAFTHFVPTNFSVAARQFLADAVANVTRKQVVCSNPLVHGRPIVSTKGVAVPLVNWGPRNLTNLTVTVDISGAPPTPKPSLASGGAVRLLTQESATRAVFHLDELDVADALILR